jgi:hypothetical protein
LVTFLDAVIYFSVVLTVSRVGLSALLSHGMSVWTSTEVEKKLWSRLCMAFEQSNHSP